MVEYVEVSDRNRVVAERRPLFFHPGHLCCERDDQSDAGNVVCGTECRPQPFPVEFFRFTFIDADVELVRKSAVAVVKSGPVFIEQVAHVSSVQREGCTNRIYTAEVQAQFNALGNIGDVIGWGQVAGQVAV